MKPCPDTFPFPLVALDETASTNQYLSQLCNQLQESVAELTTVTAEFQTAGKGQRGNTWEAEEGKNLLFSFDGIDTDLLKMLSALVVAVFLAVPYWKAKYFAKPTKRGGNN